MKSYVLILFALFSLDVIADEAFVYPAEGQTEEQQKRDEFECYQWAAEKSGFDPMNPTITQASASSSQDASGGAGKSALGGAAKGAVIAEASDGDAEKGAATGAAFGLLGSQRKKKQAEAAAQAEAQRQAKERERTLRAAYARANAACLEGRGYTVK